MSTIKSLRRWMRSLVPGFVSPQPAALSAHRHLAPGESARYENAFGRALCCLAGRLWITHDRDCKDVVVEAGETYYVTSRELMIVHALREGTLILHARDDGLQLFHNAEFAARHIVNSRLVTFERGGHLLLAVEQPKLQPLVREQICTHEGSSGPRGDPQARATVTGQRTTPCLGETR